MEEHNLQIQDSTVDCIKQRAAISQSRLQRFLFKFRDQEPILIPKTPTSKQTDGGDELDTTQDHQS